MRLLLDTHLLIWAAEGGERIPPAAVKAMDDRENVLFFSVVSIWEFVIKTGLGRRGLRGDPSRLRQGLLDSGYREVDVLASHVLAVRDLPPIHGDPFDRLLLAQSRIEGTTFLTTDALVARYPGAILKV